MKRLMKRGFTLIEIMIVVAIIALLAAIAIPNVLRSRTSANESAAVGNLRALVQGTENYNAVNASYPVGLNWKANMIPAPPIPAYSPAPFTDMPLNIQGYAFAYTGAGPPPVTLYTYTAAAQALNQTGTRAFFVDQSAVIRHCTGATGATVASLPISSPPNAACP